MKSPPPSRRAIYPRIQRWDTIRWTRRSRGSSSLKEDYDFTRCRRRLDLSPGEQRLLGEVEDARRRRRRSPERSVEVEDPPRRRRRRHDRPVGVEEEPPKWVNTILESFGRLEASVATLAATVTTIMSHPNLLPPPQTSVLPPPQSSAPPRGSKRRLSEVQAPTPPPASVKKQKTPAPSSAVLATPAATQAVLASAVVQRATTPAPTSGQRRKPSPPKPPQKRRTPRPRRTKRSPYLLRKGVVADNPITDICEDVVPLCSLPEAAMAAAAEPKAAATAAEAAAAKAAAAEAAAAEVAVSEAAAAKEEAAALAEAEAAAEAALAVLAAAEAEEADKVEAAAPAAVVEKVEQPPAVKGPKPKLTVKVEAAAAARTQKKPDTVKGPKPKLSVLGGKTQNPATFKYYGKGQLPLEDQERIEKFLSSSGNENVIVPSKSIDIGRKDFVDLTSHMAFVSSDIIDSYQSILKEAEGHKCIYSCCFLCQTFAVDFGDEDIFLQDITEGVMSEAKFWFIPLIDYEHWHLLVVDLQDGKYLHLSSIKNAKYNDGFDTACTKVSAIMERKYPDFCRRHGTRPVDWERKNMEDIPLQESSNDCAIFLLAYEEYLQKGWNMDFSQKDMTKKRGEIAAEFLRYFYTQ